MRTRHWLVFILLVSVLFARVVLAEERSTGWQCPAGSCDRNATTDDGNWHGYIGEDSNGNPTGYHVGIDFMRNSNFPVYAMDHGVIEDYNSALSGYGSACGDPGGAMLVHYIAKGTDGYRSKYPYSTVTNNVSNMGVNYRSSHSKLTLDLPDPLGFILN